MSRTPIPENLIHNPQEVKENSELFNEFCRLIPEEMIPIEPPWLIDEVSKDQITQLIKDGGFEPKDLIEQPLLIEKQQQNKTNEIAERRLIVGQIASAVIEQLRQKVENEGKFKLPFGLVVTKSDVPSSPVRTTFVSGQRKK